MSHAFTPAFRERLAGACAAFPRIAHDGGGLKRAAVALTLTVADDGSGEVSKDFPERRLGLPGRRPIVVGQVEVCDPEVERPAHHPAHLRRVTVLTEIVQVPQGDAVKFQSAGAAADVGNRR